MKGSFVGQFQESQSVQGVQVYISLDAAGAAGVISMTECRSNFAFMVSFAWQIRSSIASLLTRSVSRSHGRACPEEGTHQPHFPLLL